MTPTLMAVSVKPVVSPALAAPAVDKTPMTANAIIDFLILLFMFPLLCAVNLSFSFQADWPTLAVVWPRISMAPRVIYKSRRAPNVGTALIRSSKMA
jgi:hypothetical protein